VDLICNLPKDLPVLARLKQTQSKCKICLRVCGADSLDAKKVRGSIVVCVPGDMVGISYPEVEVHAKGGVATIIIDEDLKSFAQVFHQPAVTVISQGVGNHILAYINVTR
jgi:hypothetical protein